MLTHELPDVFDRVEFRAFWRQRDESDVLRHLEFFGHVPASLIDQQGGMASERNLFGDFDQKQVHRLDVAEGQHEARALALLRADGSENIH